MVIEQIIFGVLYLVVGAITGLPYVWLCGWDTVAAGMVTWLGPALLFIAYVLFKTSGLKNLFTRLWLLYLTAPLLMSMISKLAGWLGLTTLSNFFFSHRYEVMLFIPFILLLVLGALYGWYSVVDSLKSFRKPPQGSNTPPTDPPKPPPLNQLIRKAMNPSFSRGDMP